MTTRAQASRYPSTASTANARHASEASATTTSTAAAQPIRRNLFNSQLSRRPTRSDSTTSTATTAMLESTLDAASERSERSTASDSNSEILVRNANGDYAVPIPTVSFLMRDAGGEDDEAEDDQGLEDGEMHELENEDHLAEMLRTRTRQSNEAELLEAVRHSLKRKVEALEEDAWMFEGGRFS